MQFTEAQLSQWLAGFIWPLLRIGSMMMAAPIFSTRQIPVRFRLLPIRSGVLANASPVPAAPPAAT